MESWRTKLRGMVENSTLKPVALIPENEVVATQESQYESSIHKYGMHFVDFGLRFGDTGLLDPLRLDQHARFIPLEAQTDFCPLCDNQTSTRISQVSRTLRDRNTIVHRHLVLIPLVTDNFVERPILTLSSISASSLSPNLARNCRERCTY